MSNENIVLDIATDILNDIENTCESIKTTIKNSNESTESQNTLHKLINIMSDKLRVFDAIISLELKDEEEKRLYEKLNSMYTSSKDNGTDTSILSSLCDKISLSEKISEYIDEQLKELYN